jgi:cytoskeletal protein RodZ
MLKQERENSNLTRSDVSSRTKISLDQIVSLEEGKFLNMAPVYAKGFLRSYSELLHLDTESILNNYRLLTQNQDEDNALFIKHVPNNLGGEPKSSYILTVLGLIVLVLALVIAALYISPAFKATVSRFLPASVINELPFILTEPSVTAGQAVAAEAPVSTPIVVVEDPVVFSGRLTLKAEAPTWAQVTVDNEPVEHLLFEPGQLRSFEGQNIISVICGDGQAIRTEWNGQDRGLLGQEGPVEVFFQLSSLDSTPETARP